MAIGESFRRIPEQKEVKLAVLMWILCGGASQLRFEKRTDGRFRHGRLMRKLNMADGFVRFCVFAKSYDTRYYEEE